MAKTKRKKRKARKPKSKVEGVFNLHVGYDIPEGKCGDYEITHEPYKAGDEFSLIDARTAIMTGRPQKKGRMLSDGHFHCLSNKDGVWMKDEPREIEQAQNFIDVATGRVLIGGLGLGYVAHRIAKKTEVSGIVIVEIAREVFELVWRHLGINDKALFHCGDIYGFLRDTDLRFDYAYYDIWRSDGERTIFEHILPLRKASTGIIPNEHIYCWNEDVMYGQVITGLASTVQTQFYYMRKRKLAEIKHIYGLYGALKVPFWKEIIDRKLSKEAALNYLFHDYRDLLGSMEIIEKMKACGYDETGGLL